MKQEPDPVTSLLKSLPRFHDYLPNTLKKALGDPTGVFSLLHLLLLPPYLIPHSSHFCHPTSIHHELFAATHYGIRCHEAVGGVSAGGPGWYSGLLGGHIGGALVPSSSPGYGEGAVGLDSPLAFILTRLCLPPPPAS